MTYRFITETQWERLERILTEQQTRIMYALYGDSDGYGVHADRDTLERRRRFTRLGPARTHNDTMQIICRGIV
jgi:hypothetical protein